MAAMITSEDGLLHEFLVELQEHEYGFLDFTPPMVTPGTRSSATLSDTPLARVESTLTLIEGAKISITLDTSGYTVQEIDALLDQGQAAASAEAAARQHAGTTFESLTALLTTLSPKFGEKMHSKLCAKLQALADAQACEEEGEDQIA